VAGLVVPIPTVLKVGFVGISAGSPGSPLSPLGIVKLNAVFVPAVEAETEAEEPAAPVEVVPTVTVGVVPSSPSAPLGIVKLNSVFVPVVEAETEAEEPAAPVVVVPTVIVGVVPSIPSLIAEPLTLKDPDIFTAPCELIVIVELSII
jgi:hypothetical protein